MLELVTPHFSIDSVAAASMLPSASYIKWAVFFVCLFLLETFLVQVCAQLKNWVSFLIFEMFLYKYVSKQKMPAILKEKFKMAA